MDLVCDLDGLVQVCDWENGEEGPKAFVGDEAVVDVVDLDHGRLDEEIALIHGAAEDNLAIGRVEHLLETLELPLVHDAAIVGRVAGAIGVELVEGILHLLDEGGHDFAVDEGAVLADADLACIERLRPQQALGGELGVGMLGDDGGVPAAQLEGQRGQRLGCLLRDDFGHVLGARVEDLVPLLVEQGGSLRDGALDDRVARGIQGLADDFGEHDGGVGRRLGRLDDGGAARGNGADEGPYRQLEREVVRPAPSVSMRPRLLCGRSRLPNDQGRAQGVLPDARAHELVGQGDVGGRLVLCKARQVVGHPHAVVHAPRDLDQVRLERRLAQVAPARLGDERLIVLEGPVQLAQLLDAELERPCLVREEAGAHSGRDGRDVLDGRVFQRPNVRHDVYRWYRAKGAM